MFHFSVIKDCNYIKKKNSKETTIENDLTPDSHQWTITSKFLMEEDNKSFKSIKFSIE